MTEQQVLFLKSAILVDDVEFDLVVQEVTRPLLVERYWEGAVERFWSIPTQWGSVERY